MFSHVCVCSQKWVGRYPGGVGIGGIGIPYPPDLYPTPLVLTSSGSHKRVVRILMKCFLVGKCVRCKKY